MAPALLPGQAPGPRGLAGVLLALAILFAAPLAQAEELGIEEGGARPISALLERFRADFGDARILEIELDTEQNGDRTVPVYEIKAFTPRGAVLKVVYNARTLERLAVSGRREDREQDD